MNSADEYLRIVRDIKKIVVPYKSPFPKIRMGSLDSGDGYVIADIPYSICYSYGSNDEITFENAIHEKYDTESFTYDHTIEKITGNPAYIKFKREGISYTKTDDCNTLLSHIMENGHENNNHMLLKIDVEGHEWPVIAHDEGIIPRHFSQVVIELHFVPSQVAMCHACISKLLTFYKIIHMHPNHYPIIPYLDIEFPLVLEMTLLRNDLFDRKCEIDFDSKFPGPLDRIFEIPFPELKWWKRDK